MFLVEMLYCKYWSGSVYAKLVYITHLWVPEMVVSRQRFK